MDGIYESGKYTGSEKKATVSHVLSMGDRFLSKEDGKFYSHCILGLTSIEITQVGSPDGEHLRFGAGVVCRPQYESGTARQAMMQAKQEEAEATSPVTQDRRLFYDTTTKMNVWLHKSGDIETVATDRVEVFKANPVMFIDEIVKDSHALDAALYAYAERKLGKMETEEEVIPQPHPFKATYFPGENYWELLLPEPMSVNDMYVTIKKGEGKGKRFLDSRAKLWKEKVKDAIMSELASKTWDDTSICWDRTAPMMYQMDWYVRDNGKKNDLDCRIKLLMDAITGTEIWRDDSQVQAFYPRKVEGSVGYKGAIRVIVMPYDIWKDLTCLNQMVQVNE